MKLAKSTEPHPNDSMRANNIVFAGYHFSVNQFCAIMLVVIFPQFISLVIVWAAIRPLLIKRLPIGYHFYFWVSGVIASVALAPFLFSHIFKNEIALLMGNLLSRCLGVVLILSATRLNRLNTPLLPFGKFKMGIFAWFASFLSVALISPTAQLSVPFLPVLITASHSSSFSLAILIEFLSSCLIGPFYEELIFRGLLLNPIGKQNLSFRQQNYWDLGMSSLFAVLHYPTSFISPLLFGYIATWLRRNSGSLWPSLIVHVIHNTVIYILCLKVHNLL